jgi:hypothetical protein
LRFQRSHGIAQLLLLLARIAVAGADSVMQLRDTIAQKLSILVLGFAESVKPRQHLLSTGHK